eukprot:CAMPEP_0174853022 /NCGR_PEP_ID=MMETSP1114-20130205/27315_1 /TAXON_ID=312471 /ORGANISM="Neobodo designis, Strain CCAP 1951/1" /LENGTH=530 /DNA_ID=CAMNT_0016087643 /DNA_START=189 /DNA_END=1781 /DNA_ORIENTATION=-
MQGAYHQHAQQPMQYGQQQYHVAGQPPSYAAPPSQPQPQQHHQAHHHTGGQQVVYVYGPPQGQGAPPQGPPGYAMVQQQPVPMRSSPNPPQYATTVQPAQQQTRHMIMYDEHGTPHIVEVNGNGQPVVQQPQQQPQRTSPGPPPPPPYQGGPQQVRPPQHHQHHQQYQQQPPPFQPLAAPQQHHHHQQFSSHPPQHQHAVKQQPPQYHQHHHGAPLPAGATAAQRSAVLPTPGAPFQQPQQPQQPQSQPTQSPPGSQHQAQQQPTSQPPSAAGSTAAPAGAPQPPVVVPPTVGGAGGSVPRVSPTAPAPAGSPGSSGIMFHASHHHHHHFGGMSPGAGAVTHSVTSIMSNPPGGSGTDRDKHYWSNHPFEGGDEFESCHDAPPHRQLIPADRLPARAQFRPRALRIPPTAPPTAAADVQKHVIVAPPFQRNPADGTISATGSLTNALGSTTTTGPRPPAQQQPPPQAAGAGNAVVADATTGSHGEQAMAASASPPMTGADSAISRPAAPTDADVASGVNALDFGFTFVSE